MTLKGRSPSKDNWLSSKEEMFPKSPSNLVLRHFYADSRKVIPGTLKEFKEDCLLLSSNKEGILTFNLII